MPTWFTRACVTAGTIAVVGLLASGTASAHVTADSPDAAQGGETVITLRVSNESATATTTGVTVTLPEHAAGDMSLASVLTTPMPGWAATVAKDPTTAMPRSVTWTAAPGASIGDGQFGQFQLSVESLPKSSTLTLPVAQTYSDGSVVTWNEAPKADGSEPDHPVATLKLAANTDDSAGATTAAAGSNGTDTTARWLGGVGLLLGALGVGIGAGATLRARRRMTSA